MSAYLNALREEASREDLLAQIVRLTEERAVTDMVHAGRVAELLRANNTEVDRRRLAERALDASSFQTRVGHWMQACFGPAISADRLERGDRLLEEVLELLQSGGYPPERVAALTGYVWSRPAGEPAQEVGGVQVTLAAYCLAHGLDMHQAGETELARVWTKVETIRAKQAAKPTGSALPQAWPTPAQEPGAVPAGALTERIAKLLWERFAPEHHVEWEGETHKAEYRSVADDVLSMLRAYVTVAPTGWRLVPETATDEMIEAAWDSDAADYVGEHKRIHCLADAWKEMLAAAPVSPAAEQKVFPQDFEPTGGWPRRLAVGDIAALKGGRIGKIEDVGAVTYGLRMTDGEFITVHHEAASSDAESGGVDDAWREAGEKQLQVHEALRDSAYRAGARAGWNAQFAADPDAAIEQLTRYPKGALAVIHEKHAREKCAFHTPAPQPGGEVKVKALPHPWVVQYDNNTGSDADWDDQWWNVRAANGTHVCKCWRKEDAETLCEASKLANGYGHREDVIRALLEYITMRISGVVEVKPLVWKAEHGSDFIFFSAETPIGTFAYGTDTEGKHWHASQHKITDHTSEEEARLAAEEVYCMMVRGRANEIGILAAIEPSNSQWNAGAEATKTRARPLDLATMFKHAWIAGKTGVAWEDYDPTELIVYQRLAETLDIPLPTPPAGEG